MIFSWIKTWIAFVQLTGCFAAADVVNKVEAKFLFDYMNSMSLRTYGHWMLSS